MTLIEAVQAAIRRLHYSPKTEEAYLHWIRAFLRFHNRRQPREMGVPEVTAFLNSLAQGRRTSASSQNQALCALVFLYRRVLELDLPALDGLERAKRPGHLPEVLSAPEVAAVLARLVPPFHLMGELLYGSGLRLMECVSLRVKDIDFQRRQIMVRRGRGSHDRVALLPAGAAEELRAQTDAVERLHRHDLKRGLGEVDLPEGLGHKDVRTTMIYTHVVDRGLLGVISPLDRRAFAAPVQIPHEGSLGVPDPTPQAGNHRIRRR